MPAKSSYSGTSPSRFRIPWASIRRATGLRSPGAAGAAAVSRRDSTGCARGFAGGFCFGGGGLLRPSPAGAAGTGWGRGFASGTDADEAMLFRGFTTDDGTEYRDMYADSRTRVTEHADSGKGKVEQ